MKEKGHKRNKKKSQLIREVLKITYLK